MNYQCHLPVMGMKLSRMFSLWLVFQMIKPVHGVIFLKKYNSQKNTKIVKLYAYVYQSSIKQIKLVNIENGDIAFRKL